MSSAAVAAAAAQAARTRQQEEEDMTRYDPQDLSQWEFKILRSHTNQFRNPQALQRAITEERQGDWELLEKFDESRVRFRRPISARQQDASRPQGYDPYRTTYGISETNMVLWVVGGILLFFLILVLVLNAIGV
ncbi:MAG: hypothetical protein KIS85_00400 [Anaerolineales bacterium]|nr:hypothetical protein [Anaerolineales bacterium]